MRFGQGGEDNQTVLTSSNATHGFGNYELQYSGAWTSGWVSSTTINDTTFTSYGTVAAGLCLSQSLSMNVRLSSSTTQYPYSNLTTERRLLITSVCNAGASCPGNFTGADGLAVVPASASAC